MSSKLACAVLLACLCIQNVRPAATFNAVFSACFLTNSFLDLFNLRLPTRTQKSNQPPSILCPVSITKHADKGSNTAVVTWKEPYGCDIEDGFITKVRRSGKAPGSRFSGENAVRYEVTDSEGRRDWCIFHITVQVIKCRLIPLERRRFNTCTGFTRYGDTCTFSCVSGYKLVGQPTLSCTKEGTYNWQAPTCKKQ